jgi:hypothetical protein
MYLRVLKNKSELRPKRKHIMCISTLEAFLIKPKVGVKNF